VTEFQDTEDEEAKNQILANLGNFSYDPINYEYLRQLNVVDLFLDMLTEKKDKLIEFGISGICNLCLDKKNQEVILANNGIPLIINCLSSTNEETVLSAITTLLLLINPQTKKDILLVPVIECMKRFSTFFF